MKSLINKLYHNKIVGRIFHTSIHCLQRELEDCESVLDLGCGPSSPLKYCQNVRYSVGVEIFHSYLEESKKMKIHTEYLNKRIELVNFSNRSFDAVIMIEVLEHLPRDMGLNMLAKAEKWANKKIIISTPNGFFPMDAVDGNIYQTHLSGWNMEDFRKLGFITYGMSGAKAMYLGKNTVHSLYQGDIRFSNVRFRPQKLFYLINALLQIFVYYIPRLAFGLLAVRKISV